MSRGRPKGLTDKNYSDLTEKKVYTSYYLWMKQVGEENVQITVHEYMKIWINSGHIKNKGREVGDSYMCRHDDTKQYTVSNTYISIRTIRGCKLSTRSIRGKNVLLEDVIKPELLVLKNQSLQEKMDQAIKHMETTKIKRKNYNLITLGVRKVSYE
jgi:hypothetical protein